MACPKCNESGYISNEQGQVISHCDCELGRSIRRAQWEIKLNEAKISREYWDLKWKDFQQQPMYQEHLMFMAATESYLKNIPARHKEGNIWLIYGTEGTGKTLAASLILKEALKKDYSALYTVWTDLVDENISDDSLIDTLRTVDFLVIDDLGKDKTAARSNYTEDLLGKVIKHRFSNKLPTILVSTMEWNALITKYPVIAAMLSPHRITHVKGINFRNNGRTAR